MLLNNILNKKRYGHVISLGYNCEVSFQFFLKYHFVESSLFAWVNAVDCNRLIMALQDLDVLTSKGFRKSGVMYEDIATGIFFHGKNMGTEDAEKEELKNRVLHLKDKFLETAQDGKKNVYIFKYPSMKSDAKKVHKEIVLLYETLSKIIKNDFDLLIILEKDFCLDLKFDIPNLYIRRVDFFTPEERVTSEPYDRKGFNKIFSEFNPNFKLPKTKRFKFEEEIDIKKEGKSQNVMYDLVFSLGAACSCAQTLVGANLRQFSAPFDWLWGGDFLDRVRIFTSDFDRFIRKEDLIKCHYNNGDQNNLCDVYKNEYTGLVLNHDFQAGIPLEESYPAVKEKYDRRINRLLQTIQKAKSVLIVYIETPDAKIHSSDDEILSGMQQIHRKYPDKKIDLLYLKNDSGMRPKQFTKESLSENIVKIVANYKSQKTDALSYAVDASFLIHLLSGYHLNIPFSELVKRRVLAFLIRCIPFKFLRKKLRKKYHVK